MLLSSYQKCFELIQYSSCPSRSSLSWTTMGRHCELWFYWQIWFAVLFTSGYLLCSLGATCTTSGYLSIFQVMLCKGGVRTPQHQDSTTTNLHPTWKCGLRHHFCETDHNSPSCCTRIEMSTYTMLICECWTHSLVWTSLNSCQILQGSRAVWVSERVESILRGQKLKLWQTRGNKQITMKLMWA